MDTPPPPPPPPTPQSKWVRDAPVHMRRISYGILFAIILIILIKLRMLKLTLGILRDTVGTQWLGGLFPTEIQTRDMLLSKILSCFTAVTAV